MKVWSVRGDFRVRVCGRSSHPVFTYIAPRVVQHPRHKRLTFDAAAQVGGGRDRIACAGDPDASEPPHDLAGAGRGVPDRERPVPPQGEFPASVPRCTAIRSGWIGLDRVGWALAARLHRRVLLVLYAAYVMGAYRHPEGWAFCSLFFGAVPKHTTEDRFSRGGAGPPCVSCLTVLLYMPISGLTVATW